MNRRLEQLKDQFENFLDERKADGSLKELSEYGLVSAFVGQLWFVDESVSDEEHVGMLAVVSFWEMARKAKKAT